MFDEDDAGSGISLTDVLPVPYETIIEARQEASQMVVPFDLTNIVDSNPYVFGCLGSGGRIGRWVRYNGGDLYDLDNVSYGTEGGLGQIVGDVCGRVVVAVQTDEGYVFIGWLTPDQFSEVIVSEGSLCVH